MRVRLFVALCLFTLPSILAAAPAKSPRKAARRTVTDYFTLLPEKAGCFDDPKARGKLLGKQWGHIIDLKNDYLQVFGEGGQPSFQLAVFRFRGRDTIAISATDHIDYWFDLWRYEGQKWRNVTEVLSPVANGDDLHFVLPRQGTTIRVFASNGTLQTKLYWEKGAFYAESFDPTGHR